MNFIMKYDLTIFALLLEVTTWAIKKKKKKKKLGGGGGWAQEPPPPPYATVQKYKQWNHTQGSLPFELQRTWIQ